MKFVRNHVQDILKNEEWNDLRNHTGHDVCGSNTPHAKQAIEMIDDDPNTGERQTFQCQPDDVALFHDFASSVMECETNEGGFLDFMHALSWKRPIVRVPQISA